MRGEVAQTATAWRDDRPVVVIGAGPAGLTAAYQLSKTSRDALVLEADDTVGGISRTVARDGWRFDIGGHRFFTKVQPVEDLWHEILTPGDFLLRPRMSRIYYEGKFYDYPINVLNALRNLGVVEAARCGLSYVKARLSLPRTRARSRGTSSPTTAGGSTGTSSGPTARRCGVSHRASRPTGVRSASRACRCVKAVWEPLRARWPGAPQPGQAGHEPDRGVPVPQARSRDDVGDVPRPGREGGRRGPVGEPGGRRRTGPGGRRPCCSSTTVVGTGSGPRPRDQLDAVLGPGAGHGPAGAARRAGRRGDLQYRDFLTVALVVPATAGSPTTGSTSTRPR